MKLVRTEMQKAANDFDLALYRLVHRACDISEKYPARSKERGVWFQISTSLAILRRPVRAAMHADDREGTA